MNPVADHLLNSLSGALSKGGPAAGANGADWGESPGRGPEGSPAPSRFAAVLERVQVPASAANPAANPAARRVAAASQSAPVPLQAPAAERRRGEPVSDRGVDAAARDEAAEEAVEDAAEDRQEIATGLSAQWAALVRGEAAERRTSAADEGGADGTNEGGTGGSTIDFVPPRDGGIAAAAPDGAAVLEAAATGADGQTPLADGSASSTPPNQQATLQSGLTEGSHKARRTGAFTQAQGPVQAALLDTASLSSRGGLRTAEVGGIALAHDTSTSTQSGPSTADGTPAAAVGPTDAAGPPLLPLPTLVAWQLSPQLAVITAPQPAASDESLRAFAAAQGFDAQALHRMFGGDSAVAASPEASPGLPSGMADPSALAAWAAGAPGWWARSTNPSGLQTSGATAASSTGSGLVAVVPGGEAVVDLSGAAGVGQADAVAAGLSQALPAGTAKALGEAGVNALNGAQKASTADIMDSTDPKVSKSLADALEAFEGDGGRVRVTRNPVSAALTSGDAGRLGGAWGPSAGAPPVATSAWLALQARGGAGASGSAAGIAVTAADSQRLGAAAMSLDGASPALADVQATAPGVQGASASTAPTVMAASDMPAAAHKPEHSSRPVDAQPLDLRAHLEQGHEALSKRLGEALASRLLAQIDKGEWQIRLTVAPQHLGPIDIDLQMRGQRIDAQFQVAHGQTQALIQDNLPRLREAVGASGMDLASVWVSGGWSDRDRGNPTPGQPDNPAALALNDEASDEQTAQASAPVESDRPGRGTRPGAVDILI